CQSRGGGQYADYRNTLFLLEGRSDPGSMALRELRYRNSFRHKEGDALSDPFLRHSRFAAQPSQTLDRVSELQHTLRSQTGPGHGVGSLRTRPSAFHALPM